MLKLYSRFNLFPIGMGVITLPVEDFDCIEINVTTSPTQLDDIKCTEAIFFNDPDSSGSVFIANVSKNPNVDEGKRFKIPPGSAVTIRLNNLNQVVVNSDSSAKLYIMWVR